MGESDDYGDELLAQEPVNNISQLPANETEFQGIKEQLNATE